MKCRREEEDHERSSGEEKSAGVVVALLLDDAVLGRLGLVDEVGVCDREKKARSAAYTTRGRPEAPSSQNRLNL